MRYNLTVELMTTRQTVRRKEKEIQDIELIDRIIAQSQVCRLGLCRDNLPYVVPVSFGYDGEFIYFHTASEGLKLDYIHANPRVCFEFEHDVKVVPDDTSACKWTVSFYSVIGFGTVSEITDPQGKAYALNQIVRHYSGRDWEVDVRELDRPRTWRVTIDSISGKKSKDKVGL